MGLMMDDCISVTRYINGIKYIFVYGGAYSWGTFNEEDECIARSGKIEICTVYSMPPFNVIPEEVKFLLTTFRCLVNTYTLAQKNIDLKAIDEDTFLYYHRMGRFALRKLADWQMLFASVKQQIADKVDKLEIEYRRRLKTKEKIAKAKAVEGYVYLVYASTGHYKIGRTTEADRRVKEFVKGFGVKIPIAIKLIHQIKTDDMRRLERELHTRFASKRANGEWFTLDENDLEYIASLTTVSYKENTAGSKTEFIP